MVSFQNPVPLADYEPPLRRVRWQPCVRIIPSRFPQVDLFERVAEQSDLESVHAIEALTNSRLRDESGDMPLVTSDDRVSGPGSTWIMAPFTHVFGPGGRYSTREFGAFYAAKTLDTAVAETRYHRAQFLRATREPPMEIGMRVLHANLAARLHDLRDVEHVYPELHRSTDYSAPQMLATRLRAGGSQGVVYDSVRHEGGQCVAVFRPRALSNCRQAEHLGYLWDGNEITSVYRKSLLV